MNPDLLRLLLGRSFAPEATAAPTRGQRPVSASVAIEPGTSDAVRKLLTSPTADSLYALAGVPARGGEVPWEELTTTAGMYARSADKMMLNPYEAQPMVLSDGFTPMGRYFTDPNAPGHSVSRTDESWSPRMTLAHEAGHRYQYTKGTPPGSLRAGEESADAFAKAFDLLSRMGPDATKNQAQLDAIERQYPGTRQLLEMFLKDKGAQQRMGQVKGRMEDVLKNMIVPHDED